MDAIVSVLVLKPYNGRMYQKVFNIIPDNVPVFDPVLHIFLTLNCPNIFYYDNIFYAQRVLLDIYVEN